MDDPTPWAWSIASPLLFLTCCVGVYAHTSSAHASSAVSITCTRKQQHIDYDASSLSEKKAHVFSGT